MSSTIDFLDSTDYVLKTTSCSGVTTKKISSLYIVVSGDLNCASDFLLKSDPSKGDMKHRLHVGIINLLPVSLLVLLVSQTKCHATVSDGADTNDHTDSDRGIVGKFENQLNVP